MRLKNVLLMFPLLFVSWSAMAEGLVRGRAGDAGTGEDIPGVNVMVEGSSTVTATALDGTFSLHVPDGRTTLTLRHIAYREHKIEVDMPASSDTDLGNIRMEADALTLGSVTVTANVAIPRRTPVALSVVNSQTIETKASNMGSPNC